jgi:hypothetical protein
MTLVFDKKRQFFAADCRKSQKIGIKTLTPEGSFFIGKINALSL